mmetsp:Transcript_12049/g.37695  ORF Transcript_12049/g.37695 Transcript_12049/m.37695 type:complete len:244 (-) Transcript_12049:569-1300(-)
MSGTGTLSSQCAMRTSSGCAMRLAMARLCWQVWGVAQGAAGTESGTGAAPVGTRLGLSTPKAGAALAPATARASAAGSCAGAGGRGGEACWNAGLPTATSFCKKSSVRAAAAGRLKSSAKTSATAGWRPKRSATATDAAGPHSEPDASSLGLKCSSRGTRGRGQRLACHSSPRDAWPRGGGTINEAINAALLPCGSCTRCPVASRPSASPALRPPVENAAWLPNFLRAAAAAPQPAASVLSAT